MPGAETSRRLVRTGLRALLPLLAVLASFLVMERAEASCVEVRNLLRRGLSIGEVSEFTGFSPGDVQACAVVRGRSQRVIQPAGPAPHGAAGPAPGGFAP